MNIPYSLAVAVVCVFASSFSGSDGFSTPLEMEQPMRGGRKSGRPASGVAEGDGAVLTVRYSGGRLRELRLEQGAPTEPPLADRRLLCEDLCHAGLGGASCDASCKSQTPKALMDLWQYITNKNDTSTKTTTSPSNQLNNDPIKNNGLPRFKICPVLCDNALGQPICGCNKTWVENVRWDDICDSFCLHGSYRLRGCPECASAEITDNYEKSEYGNMNELWVEWCNYQCHKGDGGAACNCDLAPLKLNSNV